MTDSLTFGVVLTLITYYIGTMARKKWDYVIVNPILISALLIIGTLLLFGVEYESYRISTSLISFFLTPATICLAIPLYHQLALLKKNWKAIIVGSIGGVLISLTSVWLISFIFSLPREAYLTFLPNSITTAIAIGLIETHGGILTIGVAVIVVTGVAGNLLAAPVCKWFNITDPIAKGLAIGTASHAIGTTKALEMGEVEGAMASLAIVTSGIITTILMSFYVGLY